MIAREITIRKALHSDMPILRDIFLGSRKAMVEEGNLSQWNDIDEVIAKVEKDVMSSEHYVIEEDGEIIGSFSLFLEEDPTYGYIEGAWGNQGPYATIHRIASKGKGKGVLKEACRYALSFRETLRIDTHEDNISMRAALDSLGFAYRGIIYIEDSSPRLAFELHR